MTEKYYVNSIDRMPSTKWQPIEDHLKNVAEIARSFAENFGAGNGAYLAGQWDNDKENFRLLLYSLF